MTAPGDLGDIPVLPAMLRTSDGAAHLMMGDRCSLCGSSYRELRQQEDARFDQRMADREAWEGGMP